MPRFKMHSWQAVALLRTINRDNLISETTGMSLPSLE